jgi:Tol biopolymer transport system component
MITLLGGLFLVLVIGSVHGQVPMASFLCEQGDNDEVCIVYDNGEVKQVTKNKARNLTPEWSPDGNLIVFAANVKGGEAYDLFLIDLTDPLKPDVEDLTGEALGIKLNEPKWAPAGDPRIMVYATGLPGADNWDVGMLTIDARGKAGALINITNAEQEGLGQDQEGVFSPDGTKIAFTSERNDKIDGTRQFDIFIADAEKKGAGKNQINVTNALGPDHRANWSPDGTAIVFESKRDGNWELYRIDINGQNLKRLTEDDKSDRKADWSSGGIIWETKRDGKSEIYRMDPDGNNQVNLTNDPGTDSNAVWSAKGRRILFESRRDGNREIYTMDANGGGQTNLSNNPNGDDTYPRWNPQFELRPVEPQSKRFTTLGEVKRTSLLQNYPNPFNPETWIPYYLADDASVTLRIYSVKGELIRSIEVGQQAAGAYTSRQQAVYWDGKDDAGQLVASGVYFYQLLADGFSQTRRMVVMK